MITRSVCISASFHCHSSSSSQSWWNRMAVEKPRVRMCPICGWKGLPQFLQGANPMCRAWQRFYLLVTQAAAALCYIWLDIWHVCCLNVDILQTSWNPVIHEVTLQSYSYKYCNTCLLWSKLNKKKKKRFLENLLQNGLFVGFLTKSNHQVYQILSH